jgi:hypothetical protein
MLFQRCLLPTWIIIVIYQLDGLLSCVDISETCEYWRCPPVVFRCLRSSEVSWVRTSTGLRLASTVVISCYPGPAVSQPTWYDHPKQHSTISTHTGIHMLNTSVGFDIEYPSNVVDMIPKTMKETTVWTFPTCAKHQATHLTILRPFLMQKRNH